MIKFILLIILSLAAVQIGIDILARELYKSKKITSEEYEYYTSCKYIFDKITSLFKNE
jgi:hypothetical protein